MNRPSVPQINSRCYSRFKTNHSKTLTGCPFPSIIPQREQRQMREVSYFPVRSTSDLQDRCQQIDI
ncbi:MAG: hypothetical protein F6J90_16195 [Moorea sp. SIOASIH]|nr:hypothetical protein [Moorena sp. SIOASIH]